LNFSHLKLERKLEFETTPDDIDEKSPPSQSSSATMQKSNVEDSVSLLSKSPLNLESLSASVAETDGQLTSRMHSGQSTSRSSRSGSHRPHEAEKMTSRPGSASSRSILKEIDSRPGSASSVKRRCRRGSIASTDTEFAYVHSKECTPRGVVLPFPERNSVTQSRKNSFVPASKPMMMTKEMASSKVLLSKQFVPSFPAKKTAVRLSSQDTPLKSPRESFELRSPAGRIGFSIAAGLSGSQLDLKSVATKTNSRTRPSSAPLKRQLPTDATKFFKADVASLHTQAIPEPVQAPPTPTSLTSDYFSDSYTGWLADYENVDEVESDVAGASRDTVGKSSSSHRTSSVSRPQSAGSHRHVHFSSADGKQTGMSVNGPSSSFPNESNQTSESDDLADAPHIAMNKFPRRQRPKSASIRRRTPQSRVQQERNLAEKAQRPRSATLRQSADNSERERGQSSYTTTEATEERKSYQSSPLTVDNTQTYFSKSSGTVDPRKKPFKRPASAPNRGKNHQVGNTQKLPRDPRNGAVSTLNATFGIGIFGIATQNNESDRSTFAPAFATKLAPRLNRQTPAKKPPRWM